MFLFIFVIKITLCSPSSNPQAHDHYDMIVHEYIRNKTKIITYKQMQNGSHASVVVYILILMTFYLNIFLNQFSRHYL